MIISYSAGECTFFLHIAYSGKICYDIYTLFYKARFALMKAVITVIGHDTVGVIAKVSAVCAALNINIEDVTQSIMQELFCMIMLVDLSVANASSADIHARFAALGQEMGMQVTLTRQEVFDAMHVV